MEGSTIKNRIKNLLRSPSIKLKRNRRMDKENLTNKVYLFISSSFKEKCQIMGLMSDKVDEISHYVKEMQTVDNETQTLFIDLLFSFFHCLTLTS